MKLFGSLCILGLALAEDYDLGPRGKNKKKNKEPQADEVAFAPNVPDSIAFEQATDFTVLQGNMMGNVTIVAYDDQQPPQLVTQQPLDGQNMPWTISIGVNDGTVSGVTTCAFDAASRCTFTDLVIDTFGPSFRMDFGITTGPAVPATFGVIVLDANSSPALLVSGSTTTSTTTTTTSTTTTTTPGTTTTTTTTTKWYPKDMECTIKKKKNFNCSKKNMHTGEWIIQHLMDIRQEGRDKITNLDISYNPNLPLNTVVQILGHLKNLRNLKIRGMAFEHGQLPTQIFVENPLLKTVDFSDNNFVCVRGVFNDLENLKKIVYGENPLLNDATGRKKAKKNKVITDIGVFNSFPKENCIYI